MLYEKQLYMLICFFSTISLQSVQFKMMTTQLIPGALRETNNPLLLKADIGKPLKRGFIMPPDHFTFGKTTHGNIGASETMNGYSTVKAHKQKELKQDRDFVRLNKAATSAGLVTAKEHFQYRATHDLAPLVKEREVKSAKTLPDINTVYGISTKPIPVFDLLEHKYQDTWTEEVKAYNERKKKKELEHNIHKSYGDTRASRLRRYSPPVDPPPLWQMSKFQKKAVPALDTFRSEEARKKAFGHHATDCTARTGVFGHGNYENAKS